MNRVSRRALLHAVWIVPQITSVGLPAHAQCSSEEAGEVDCISPRVPIVNANNLVCTDFIGAPNQASFELENLEPEDLIVVGLDSEIDAVSGEHISPALPFILEAGATVDVVVESETIEEFDCASSDYRLSYLFDSETGRFKGISGAIRLTPSS
ncbi:MAG: hypothetical protein ACI8XV_002865 [Arenicella sp.]|jgi:hypothetical protein